MVGILFCFFQICLTSLFRNVVFLGIQMFQYCGIELSLEVCHLMGLARNVAFLSFMLAFSEWHIFAYLYLFVRLTVYHFGYQIIFSILSFNCLQVWKSIGRLNEEFAQATLFIINSLLILFYIAMTVFAGHYDFLICLTKNYNPFNKSSSHLTTIIVLPIAFCVIMNITMHVKNYKSNKPNTSNQVSRKWYCIDELETMVACLPGLHHFKPASAVIVPNTRSGGYQKDPAADLLDACLFYLWHIFIDCVQNLVLFGTFF